MGTRMLVMERLRGAPLTDLAAIRGITRADPEQVLVNALNAWFGSVLAAETFHADMHAGAHFPPRGLKSFYVPLLANTS